MEPGITAKTRIIRANGPISDRNAGKVENARGREDPISMRGKAGCSELEVRERTGGKGSRVILGPLRLEST